MYRRGERSAASGEGRGTSFAGGAASGAASSLRSELALPRESSGSPGVSGASALSAIALSLRSTDERDRVAAKLS